VHLAVHECCIENHLVEVHIYPPASSVCHEDSSYLNVVKGRAYNTLDWIFLR
jgi:hypothetical protein